LYFQVAILAGGDDVAFDQRKIQPDRLPIVDTVTFDIYVAAHHADADDARFHVVVVGLIIVGEGSDWNGEKGE
jgi:hypothetical protein